MITVSSLFKSILSEMFWGENSTVNDFVVLQDITPPGEKLLKENVAPGVSEKGITLCLTRWVRETCRDLDSSRV